MNSIGVHSTINRVIGLFYRLGLWVEDKESTGRKVKRKFFYLIIFGVFVFSIAAGAAASDDKYEIIFLVAITISCVILAGKLIFILLKHEEILAYVSEICVHSIEDQEEFIRVNNKLKSFVKFVNYFIFMIFLGFLFIVGLPATSSMRNLPINIWFPFDYQSKNFVYCIAYGYVSFGVIFAIVCSLFNIIVWYIMVNCAIKFELLGSQFRRLGDIKVETTTVRKRKISEAEKQNLFHRDLIAAIRSHLKLKNTTDSFQSCFSSLFFLQIATGGFCICGSVYTLVFSSSDNWIQHSIYLLILGYNIFDVFVITYLGNEIELNSDRLSYCLYESNWFDQSVSTKKCVIIIMEVFKQRQQLVIWKLYPLNLETFIRIIRFAYSSFNILQNLT